MNASKQLDQNGGHASLDPRRKTSAVPRPGASALCRRRPVIALLPVLILVAAPFLCADGITLNLFDATGFVSGPSNVLGVSSSNLNFSVASGGYFTSFASSQTIASGFNQTSGPIAPGLGITPPGGPSGNVTTNPPGGPSVNATTIPTGGPSIDVTAVPEPASFWLVGLGLAILGLWGHRKRMADRHV